MSNNYKVLILEDDLETLGKLFQELYNLECEIEPKQFEFTALSTFEQVEKLINAIPASEFDVILLDRDCKLGGSFHTLDIDKFGPEKIISISSTPKWNEQAYTRGVTKVVLKEYDDLGRFAQKVCAEIKVVLGI
ncbi:MAG TPA: hypothetical protein VJH71_03105 [Candidatus Paceibacterota bacterium]